MKNLWDHKLASRLKKTPLLLRVYSSQLLGLDSGLVLHGGGNTSVKINETNIFVTVIMFSVFRLPHLGGCLFIVSQAYRPI